MDGYCSKVLSSKQQFNTCAKNILLFFLGLGTLQAAFIVQC